MSKSDVDYDVIKKDNVNKKIREPKFNKDKPINGFDTETTPKGDVYLITRSLHNKEPEHKYKYPNYSNKEIRSLTTDEILKFLTCPTCRNANNVWYNLSFDVNAMLKDLDLIKLEELNQLSRTIYHGDEADYIIQYFKNKYLGIKKGVHEGNDFNVHHTYDHYDVAQFFYTSLNEACKEWLNETKKELNSDTLTDTIKILKNFNDIIKYGKKDADLVRRLWRKFVDKAENLGIPCGRPYSTGYLAQQTLENKLSNKPTNLKPYQKYAWQSYFGGRFEIFRKGDVGDVAIPDINSAYPHVMAKLPDPNTLSWDRKKDLTIDDVRQSDYALIKVIVTTNKDKKAQPFPRKINNKVKFPVLSGHEVTTIKQNFLYYVDNNYITDYEIIDGFIANETPTTKYPFNFINELYDRRKQYERECEYKKAKVLKITLNSMYGKTIQTTLKRRRKKDVRRKMKNKADTNNKGENLIPSNYLSVPPSATPPTMKDRTVDLVEYLQAGTWFNPFIATHITALTRLELLKTIDKYNLLDNLIMFATDSVMVDEHAYKKSKLPKNEVKKGLGNWDLEKTGKAKILASGIYEVDTGNELELGTRGFNAKSIKETGGLTNLFKENKDKKEYELITRRPRSYGEAIWGNVIKDKIASFQDVAKKLSVNIDDKREWWHPENITFGDLLNNDYKSDPINLKEVQRDQALKAWQRDKKLSGPTKKVDMRQSVDDIGRDLLGDYYDPHLIDSNLTKKEQIEQLKELARKHKTKA